MHRIIKIFCIGCILPLIFQSHALSQCIARYGYSIDSFYTALFMDTSLVDVSMGPHTRAWYINDSMTSTREQFSYQFPDTGVYSVCLSIVSGDSLCVDSICKDIFITMDSCSASFNTHHVEDYTYSFNNTSSDNMVSWHWSFGDGYVSEEQNPSHTYQFPGRYIICLYAEDENHICSHCYCDTVEVLDTTPCRADYIYYDDNYKVYFTNNSTGPVEDVLWDFGDGTTSTAISPHHTYLTTGTYTVKLMVYGPASIHPYDTITNEIIISYTYSRQPRYKLSGQVYTPDSSLIYSGSVVLIRKDSNGYCFNMDTVNISFGAFSFSGIKKGKYYIKAIPSFKMAFFPSTYYVSASSIEKAYLVPISSNTGSIDIMINSGSTITNENNINHTINLYPNPADKYVKIDLPPGSKYLSILDLYGKTIRNKIHIKNFSSFDLHLKEISPGTYIIFVETDKHHYYKKLMVQ
jgi:PKD repeat protein